MSKTKTFEKRKYTYKDLEKASEWIKFYEQKFSALEIKIENAATKLEEENIWEEIKLTKKEIKRWRALYSKIECYLENEISNSNARVREIYDRWNNR